MRIEYVGLCTNTGEMWQVDGKEVLLVHRSNLSSETVAERIREYGRTLVECLYMTDPTLLPDFFRFFGGLGFVRLGLAFGDCFRACFFHYADIFALEWMKGGKNLHSKHIGYRYVFETMLPGIRYDFRYILDKTEDSGDFCRIVDRAFEKLWVPMVQDKMRETNTLSEICRRVGAVRTFRYMSLAGEPEMYLRSIASLFTERREVISSAKLKSAVFGAGTRFDDDSSRDLIELLRNVTTSEKEIQYERFPAENRKAMSHVSDVWVLYQKHGRELCSVTLDFSGIRSAGMKSEAKAYYRHLYKGNEWFCRPHQQAHRKAPYL